MGTSAVPGADPRESAAGEPRNAVAPSAAAATAAVPAAPQHVSRVLRRHQPAAARGDGEEGAPRGAPTHDPHSYFARATAQRRRPVATPVQLSTPQAEQVPLETLKYDDDPRKRVEWQTMLSSVLESEVLSSETKRIASADAPVTLPNELMQRRWLEVRSVLRGLRGRDLTEEDACVRQQREALVRAVLRDLEACRSAPEHEPRAPEAVLEEVRSLLDRVDAVEALFVSQRELVTQFPEWGQARVQHKLAALYAWYNMSQSLRVQLMLLERWTGSASDGAGPADPTRSGGERGGLVERIFREGNLQETFEKRTLSALHQLVYKAKDTLRMYHSEFEAMALPSLERDVTKLVQFPIWLVKGALRQRLDYADKLREPNPLLVESLFDDLRAAIALACRVKLQYARIAVPDVDHGWDLDLGHDEAFDSVLCSALVFYFRLLHFRLKGALYFKETEIVEPEWNFLCSAVQVVPGGDVIVAGETANIVNRLLARIITYFERELHAPWLTGGARAALPPTERDARSAAPPAPLTVPEKARWIHTVFSNVRIRSRKLLGFAREVRSRLEIAAEYDLRSLRGDGGTEPGTPIYDLSNFLQTLQEADYFLVYTTSFEERGVYVLAEPSLHDRPEVIQELLYKCIRQLDTRASRGSSLLADAATSVLDPDNILDFFPSAYGRGERGRVPSTPAGGDAPAAPPNPEYLLLLSPRDAFLWTGRVMMLPLPYIDVNLKEERLRVIADGPQERLQLCKEHFMSQFAARRSPVTPETPAPTPGGSAFPLATVYDRMAHLSEIQRELKLINKGAYVLSDTIVHAVPYVRRTVHRMHTQLADAGDDSAAVQADRRTCDELVHNCFTIAADQGSRVLTYIESARLKRQMSATLGLLAIEWITFICDDCVPTDRRTFKWAVAALEFAMNVTQGENIFLLSEGEFDQLKSKVSSCIALLISHFDILGARSSAVKAQEEQERREREKHTAETAAPPPRAAGEPQELERRFVDRALERDAQRQAMLTEHRLIGRVLDDTRLEDRNLQLLASKGVQIRWQQGRFIGGGTFGTVYLAVNLDTGGLMAVKEIRFQELSSTPSLYKQIHDEMNVMEMLRHPNIVEYYGIEVHRDKVYIFEEYCQGGSLAQLLEHGRIEDEVVVQVYALQMLEGLMYLHSKGVVHRDIKPDNILLDHMGVIKFVDFGAAKVLSKSSRTLQRSRKPGVVPPNSALGARQSLQGTPMYMSPEVIKGEARGRFGAMDVWSLGCVVLECATGSRPWSQLDNEWAIMFHIGMAQQHPPLPDESQLSRLGIDFLRRCLTIDPYERPSVSELRSHPWICNLVAELERESEASVADELGEQLPPPEEAPTEHPLKRTESDPRPLQQRNAQHQPADSSLGADAVGTAARHTARPPLSRMRTVAAPTTVDVATAPSGTPLTPPTSDATHVPGRPNHEHPGYEAIIADKQYQREEAQRKQMLEPDA